jgi:hypothetical protein
VTKAAVRPGVSIAWRSASAIVCASSAGLESSIARMPDSRPLPGLEPLPQMGEFGGLHRMGEREATHRAGIAAAAPAPAPDLVPPNPEPIEQQLEMILRMRLDRPSAFALLGGPVAAERVPLVLRRGDVDAGKYDHAVGQPAHHRHQPRNRGRAGGDTRGDHETRRRRRLPALGDPVEQQVAPLRHVDRAARDQFGGPAFQDRLEQVERMLPVLRQFGRRHDVGQPSRIEFLDQQLVEGRGEVARQPDRLAGVDRLADRRAHLADQPGEDHLPVERIDDRRDRRGVIRLLVVLDRIEQPAKPLFEIGIADRDQPRQQQPALGAPHERVADRPRRPVVGNEDDAAGETERIAAMGRDQPGRERVAERPVRRDGED